MQPLQDLLHRIRCDAEFAKGVFALGYYDRIADQEQIVPLAAISLDPRSPGKFSVEDERRSPPDPLHRVRMVYKGWRGDLRACGARLRVIARLRFDAVISV